PLVPARKIPGVSNESLYDAGICAAAAVGTRVGGRGVAVARGRVAVGGALVITRVLVGEETTVFVAVAVGGALVFVGTSVGGTLVEVGGAVVVVGGTGEG